MKRFTFFLATALMTGACAQPSPAPPPATVPPAIAMPSAGTPAPAPVVTADAATGTPLMPYEDRGACPFEGCTYREWTANAAVDMRADRRHDAPVAFRLPAGEKVTAITGVVVTIKPGRVRFRQATTLDTSNGRVDVTPDDTLYLLTYLGEGNFKVWLRGRLYAFVDGVAFLNGACDHFPARCSGSIVEKARSEWWIQLRSQAGRVGWTDEADKFDGKDALGG